MTDPLTVDLVDDRTGEKLAGLALAGRPMVGDLVEVKRRAERSWWRVTAVAWPATSSYLCQAHVTPAAAPFI